VEHVEEKGKASTYPSSVPTTPQLELVSHNPDHMVDRQTLLAACRPRAPEFSRGGRLEVGFARALLLLQ
jgi:hypothetical protein